MKNFLLTYFFLFSVSILLAQKQTNNWYFGNRVGLDFNQSPPLPLNNGTANSQEGSSSMSDNNGRLLFYTNGISVNNRKHEPMLNGNNIFGDLSSTNNVVIVPAPGNDSVYYMFTIGSARQEFPVFSYSVIDMKADGGFGAVVQKNILIENITLEKLAAIRHCNNRDVWIVIRKWLTDEYHTYLLTPTGLNPVPVVSRTGLVINGQINNSIGVLKFFSKGNKLAAIHAFDNDAVELMDFDNTTGVISNPILFNPNAVPHQSTFTGVYGAEFSPDGSLLYVSSNNSPSEPATLYQFDITSNNAATILASKQIIAQTNPWFAGALQLGPDNRIYWAMWNDTAISVIDNPNIFGPGCNFIFNKILLGPFNSLPVQFGLPNFMQSYFDQIGNPYDFSRVGNCSNLNVTFTINRTNGIDSVKWDFGDGQQSQILQPTNNYINPGFYDVKLIVYKVDCSGLYDTIKRKIWITDGSEFLGPDTSSCNSLALELGTDEITGVNYLWNTGHNGSRITTTGFGAYWLEMEQNGCKVRDTVNVTAKPVPVVNLGPDTSICLSKTVVLDASSALADDYSWSTGESSPFITINKTGTYYVTVTLNSCVASDTVEVLPGDCEIFIPTAFTPNHDNKNEIFGVLNEVTVQQFSMQVFSKWGQVIFKANNITQKWDGTYKGKDMPNGAYLWIINYINNKGLRKYLQGTVMLIR